VTRPQSGLLVLFVLIAYPMWVVGGTQPAWQFPLPVLAALLLGITALDVRRNLLRDPVALGGALLLLLLLLQWANSNRPQIFDSLLQAWTVGPPAVPFLPSSVVRADAAEMLRWFFPVWAIALAARHLVARRDADRRLLMRAVLIAASVLAAGSIIQFAIATQWEIGVIPSHSYFVTSFGYANHAGSFFVLCLCLALGETLSTMLHRHPVRHRVTALICGLLCFGGVLVSLSRSAILLSLACIVVSILYLLLYRDAGGSAARFNRVMAALAILITAFLLLYPLFGTSVTDELSKRSPKTSDLNLSANWTYSAVDNIRPLYRQVAVGIFKDYPWFGAGGWSVRHLGILYLPAQSHRLLQTPGAANTHNDLLQFLSEFGLVGVALLWISIGIMAAPLIRYPLHTWRSPRVFFSLLGLLVILIHSAVDLPFRCPAVLFLWTLTLALAGCTSSRTDPVVERPLR